jgi:hypothetical protein
MGMLQRDAAFYLDGIDRIESAITRSSRQQMVAELEEVASDIEENQHLLAVDKTRVNVISCMVLPGAVRAMQAHLWTQILADAALTSLSIERYRQETGHPPSDLQVLVPEYLQKIPEDPFSGESLHYQTTTNGYAVSSRGAMKKADNDKVRPTDSRESGWDHVQRDRLRIAPASSTINARPLSRF